MTQMDLFAAEPVHTPLSSDELHMISVLRMGGISGMQFGYLLDTMRKPGARSPFLWSQKRFDTVFDGLVAKGMIIEGVWCGYIASDDALAEVTG